MASRLAAACPLEPQRFEALFYSRLLPSPPMQFAVELEKVDQKFHGGFVTHDILELR
jgi:hypothetical protein